MSQLLEQNSVIRWSDLLAAFHRDRLRVLMITAAAAVIGVLYAFLAPEWYRAEVTMVSAEQKGLPGGLSQLGGLASLAGISIPSGNSPESVAVLKSRGFIREFIEEKKLVDVILEGFGKRGEGRDVRDAVQLFDTRVRTVVEEKRDATIRLIIIWRDPKLAADWANELVGRLNDRQRAKAQREAERNVQYLQREIANTNVVSLQQSLGRVLESEMQKLLLARGNAEFSFKIVDRASVPKQRFTPSRLIIVLLSVIAGLLFSVALTVAGCLRASQIRN